MKLFSSATSIIIPAAIISIISTVVAVVQGVDIGDNDFFQVGSLASDPVGRCESFAHCAALKLGRLAKGNKLFLNSCEDYEEGWRIVTEDAQGNANANVITFHAGNDNDKCMQAGHGGAIGTWVDHRATMRIYQCDSTNPLQRFKWKSNNDKSCGGGPITMEDDDAMCVTWSGTKATPGTDSIIVMPCEDLEDARAKGWIAI
jgi:hypothetical protein